MVSTESTGECKDSLFLVCHGRGLDKKDIFGKSDPFLEFYRFQEDGR